jgi:large subunit ribosomal protein L35
MVAGHGASMPKQKTNRSALKRFKVTKGRKVRRNKAFRRHLLAGRSTKRKRNLRRPALVSKAETKTYLRLLGEG